MSEQAATFGRELPVAAVRRGPGRAVRLKRLVANNPLGVVGAALIGLLLLTAALANVLAPFDPSAQIARRLTGPGGEYLLGTDELGRDILSRIIYGTRISLYVGVVSVGIALGIGGTLGLLAGYFGGWVDNLLMRLMDVMFAIPSLVLAIAITGILGPNLRNAMIAIAWCTRRPSRGSRAARSCRSCSTTTWRRRGRSGRATGGSFCGMSYRT